LRVDKILTAAKNSDTPPKPQIRKILFSGGSHLIALPKQFLELHGLKAGDKVAIVPGTILQIVPVKE
jgi:hypothetical protein